MPFKDFAMGDYTVNSAESIEFTCDYDDNDGKLMISAPHVQVS